MEQKSFYSEIKVQSSSKSINTIPALQLFHSLGWNRWNTLPVLPIHKKMLHSICYSSIPPLPIPKNYQKECSLNFSCADSWFAAIRLNQYQIEICFKARSSIKFGQSFIEYKWRTDARFTIIYTGKNLKNLDSVLIVNYVFLTFSGSCKHKEQINTNFSTRFKVVSRMF